jgi:hypothetical protein
MNLVKEFDRETLGRKLKLLDVCKPYSASFGCFKDCCPLFNVPRLPNQPTVPYSSAESTYSTLILISDYDELY